MRGDDEDCDQNVEIYFAGTNVIDNETDKPILIVFKSPSKILTNIIRGLSLTSNYDVPIFHNKLKW